MFERNALARRALSEVDAEIDVFVYTQSEFDELKQDFSSIPETVLFEGRELALD